MMKRNNRKQPFTLIELLVSMGLLTLLVMLMLQLFSGAQRLWIASEKRSNIYADARVALELMSDLVNLTYFTYGENAGGSADPDQDMVFSIDKSGDNDFIIFAARTNRLLPHKDSNIRFISFRCGSGTDDKDKLYMTVCADSGSAQHPNSASFEDQFYNYFPPFGESGHPANRDAARAALNTELTPNSDENKYSQVIAENVVGMSIIAYKLQNDGTVIQVVASDIKQPPYQLEIQLSVLNQDDYAKYKELTGDAAKRFLAQHKYTFTRSIFLGNRWAL